MEFVYKNSMVHWKRLEESIDCHTAILHSSPFPRLNSQGNIYYVDLDENNGIDYKYEKWNFEFVTSATDL